MKNNLLNIKSFGLGLLAGIALLACTGQKSQNTNSWNTKQKWEVRDMGIRSLNMYNTDAKLAKDHNNDLSGYEPFAVSPDGNTVFIRKLISE